MKHPRTIVAASLLVLLASMAGAQREPGWKAQGDLDLMLGQYFFNDSAGSVNGFAGANAQLLRSFSSGSGFYIDGRAA
ncbi:MAG: hypothetical protein AAB262_10000 [Elusimicrobiota bacterium]